MDGEESTGCRKFTFNKSVKVKNKSTEKQREEKESSFNLDVIFTVSA